MPVKAMLSIQTIPQDTELVYDIIRHMNKVQPGVPALFPKMLLNGPHNIVIDEVIAEDDAVLYSIIMKIRTIEGVESVIPNIILKP